MPDTTLTERSRPPLRRGGPKAKPTGDLHQTFNVRVSEGTRDFLRQQSVREGKTMGQVVDDLIAAYKRVQIT